MSSMAILFQVAVESGSPFQETRQFWPSLKILPGEGSLGMTSARVTKADANTAMKARAEETIAAEDCDVKERKG